MIVGVEVCIVVDYAAQHAFPSYVNFVSPEAQFTPKQVETRTEREKLMFRVKLQVPKALVKNFIESIKTGTRGVGYVKVDPNAAWPEWLQEGLVTVPTSEPAPAAPAGTAAAPDTTKAK